MLDVVVFLVSLGVRVIRAMCRRRADLVLENVALRQQVTALKKVLSSWRHCSQTGPGWLLRFEISSGTRYLVPGDESATS